MKKEEEEEEEEEETTGQKHNVRIWAAIIRSTPIHRH